MALPPIGNFKNLYRKGLELRTASNLSQFWQLASKDIEFCGDLERIAPRKSQYPSSICILFGIKVFNYKPFLQQIFDREIISW